MECNYLVTSGNNGANNSWRPRWEWQSVIFLSLSLLQRFQKLHGPGGAQVIHLIIVSRCPIFFSDTLSWRLVVSLCIKKYLCIDDLKWYLLFDRARSVLLAAQNMFLALINRMCPSVPVNTAHHHTIVPPMDLQLSACGHRSSFHQPCIFWVCLFSGSHIYTPVTLVWLFVFDHLEVWEEKKLVFARLTNHQSEVFFYQ